MTQGLLSSEQSVGLQWWLHEHVMQILAMSCMSEVMSEEEEGYRTGGYGDGMEIAVVSPGSWQARGR